MCIDVIKTPDVSPVTLTLILATLYCLQMFKSSAFHSISSTNWVWFSCQNWSTISIISSLGYHLDECWLVALMLVPFQNLVVSVTNVSVKLHLVKCTNQSLIQVISLTDISLDNVNDWILPMSRLLYDFNGQCNSHDIKEYVSISAHICPCQDPGNTWTGPLIHVSLPYAINIKLVFSRLMCIDII